jgi:DUF1680 family protein
MTRPFHRPFSANIHPSGWLKGQMQFDLTQGVVGALDELVPDLIKDDDIYDTQRLSLKDKAKDVGAVAQDDDWEVQYLWWNSETQSNWWDGYVRHALLVGDEEQKAKVDRYISKILTSQDEDGYLGIYGPDLRYKATGENGELWAQASLLRVLLGYYEHTLRQDVLDAVMKAVKVTITAWPIGDSEPFNLSKPYAGVGHGLVYTDILDRLFDYTQDKTYQDYAHFLYLNYCQYTLSENDIQWRNLLNPDYLFQGHGVHTWEHLRPLLVACNSPRSERLRSALSAYLKRLPEYITPSGAPIGDEFIVGKTADSTRVGYEYCSLHEWLDSLIELTRNTGETKWLDEVERLFFNAAQGARHPDGKGIAYLKTDNSYSMTGDAGCHECGPSVHQVQTRYKYSPTHQEAAVCCVPNAGRITPYYVRSMWMEYDEGIFKALYGASEFRSRIKGTNVVFEEVSAYPAKLNTTIHVKAEKATFFALKLRVPAWATSVVINGDQSEVNNGVVTLQREWLDATLEIQFHTCPIQNTDQQGELYFTYGPLVYTRELEASLEVEREFLDGRFSDRKYRLTEQVSQTFTPTVLSELSIPWVDESSTVVVFGEQVPTLTIGDLTLRPLAGTILRQTTFVFS